MIKETREEIVGQCLQCSCLWKDIKVLKLKENMCLKNSTQRINAEGHHLLSNYMKCGEAVDALLDALYLGITVLDPKENNDDYFLKHTIEMMVKELNESVLNRFRGLVFFFNGADLVITKGGVDEDVQYPMEYLNTINVSGIPLAKLKLKTRAPIMIL